MIEIEAAWQKVAKHLVWAEAAFREFQSVAARRENLEKLPAHNQHILGLTTMKSNFLIAMERLSAYSRRNGSISFLLLEETEALEKSKDEEIDE